MAGGLEAIHASDILHRDLKPENVLAGPDGRVCIVDLGVAKLRNAAAALTGLGSFAGSVAYMAPEQFRDGEAGPAADLYALGVTLYELATGENPFRHEDDAAASIHAHLTLEPRPACSASPRLSPSFCALLDRLLAKHPSARIPSAGALLEALGDGWGSRGACAAGVLALAG